MSSRSHLSSYALSRLSDRRIARTSGQMTIEFVAFFPVMLIIAIIVFNSILFLSECAAFDRIFRESTSVLAPSPASDESADHICAQIETGLDRFTQKTYLSCDVSANGRSDGMILYSGTLFFTPTIFGAYPLRSIFGVALSPIEHTTQITIDTYKPGVFL